MDFFSGAYADILSDINSGPEIKSSNPHVTSGELDVLRFKSVNNYLCLVYRSCMRIKCKPSHVEPREVCIEECFENRIEPVSDAQRKAKSSNNP